MGTIAENPSPQWVQDVKQIEVGEPVGGGPTAPVNVQAKNLVDRTSFLKIEVDEAKGRVSTLETKLGTSKAADFLRKDDNLASITNAATARGNLQAAAANHTHPVTSSLTDASEATYASAKAIKTVNDRVTQIAGSIIPAGLIAMWSGTISTIPAGWGLCDGQSGRPNLLDKFIKGVATATTNPGATGGSHSMALSVANMPAHTHTGPSHTHTSAAHSHDIGSLNVVSAGAHTHQLTIQVFNNKVENLNPLGRPIDIGYNCVTYGLGGSDGGTFVKAGVGSGNDGGVNAFLSEISSVGTLIRFYKYTTSAGAHTHAVSGNVASTTPGATGASGTAATSSMGNGTAFDKRPAFYELAFIIKL